jgi:glycosyltransferase involved in cell wall biosynthesis
MSPVLLSEKLAAAQFVVAESDYAGRYLDGVTGFRFSQKVHRIYNGLELGEVERLSASTQNGPNGPALNGSLPYILSVGQLVPRKGHATLIQVCSRLRARGRSFRCRIIGEGPERATLERLIVDNHLQGCVELAGPMALDHVYAELRKADVFAMLAEIGPSGNRDGLPTVVLEAMAAGLPVLSTNLVAIPEMVQDGVTGVLVPERDVDAASRALERLLESAELRREMGLAGLARVRQLFDLEHSADQLAALLTNHGHPASR